MLFLDVKTIQRAVGAIPDGYMGSETRAAIEKAISKQVDFDRKLIAVQQNIMRLAGIDVGTVDGYYGPQTAWAVEQWQNMQRDADVPEPSSVAPIWPRQDEVETFYGPAPAERELVSIELPYTMYLAWDKSTAVSHMRLHRRCADSAKRVFERVLAEYTESRLRELRLDLFAGSYNPRKMRGGTRWSMHAYGCAIDIDSAHNQLRWSSDRASLAHPVYSRWWKAWEDEGWVSLGRERNFDWMHVQAARL